MNASISMGASAHNPLQALARLLPTGTPSHYIPLCSQPIKDAIPLQFVTTDTGFIAYRNGAPVAWVVQGFHHGQQNGAPKRCDFVDVAYVIRKRYGIHLETANLETLDEAIEFLVQVFGGAA